MPEQKLFVLERSSHPLNDEVGRVLLWMMGLECRHGVEDGTNILMGGAHARDCFHRGGAAFGVGKCDHDGEQGVVELRQLRASVKVWE